MDNPANVPFTVSALNTTQVLQTNTNSIPYPLTSSLLKLNITAVGTLPNSHTPQKFTHEYYFHALDLSKVALQDPDLELSYSEEKETFTVKATKRVAAWVWLDISAGTVANFDKNAFWLLLGDGGKEVGFKVKNDTSEGKWVEGLKVRSLWDNMGD